MTGGTVSGACYAPHALVLPLAGVWKRHVQPQQLRAVVRHPQNSIDDVLEVFRGHVVREGDANEARPQLIIETTPTGNNGVVETRYDNKRVPGD
jgi:hypothetical protein